MEVTDCYITLLLAMTEKIVGRASLVRYRSFMQLFPPATAPSIHFVAHDTEIKYFRPLKTLPAINEV